MTATATGVLLIPLLIITLLLGLVLLIWKLWAFGSLFPRLGLRAAEGWVPILNQARLNRRGGLPGWLSLGRLALLIALIGRAAVGVADPGAALPAAHLLDLVCWALVAVVCIGRVVEIVAMHRISAEAGRGAGFTVLAALLTPIWAMLLARGIGRGRVLGDAEAVEPRFEAPPFSASVEAAETHAVPTLGIAGVRRSGAGPVNPLGSATEAEYERLAAESFLEPPAAPLGSAAVAEPFSWTAARRPLDDERAGAGSPPPAIPPVPAVSSPPPDLAPSPAVSKPTGITGAFPPLRPGEVRRPEPRIERGGDPDR
ncbi:MAG: hypothetical protein KDB25_09625, partial [Leucobacter sp.]|nr:hypothetical protein [Leucobacter sp.]